MATCMVKGASLYAEVHLPARKEGKSPSYHRIERMQHAGHIKEYSGSCAVSFSP